MLDLETNQTIVIDPMAHRNAKGNLPDQCKCLSYVILRLLNRSEYSKHYSEAAPQQNEDWIVHLVNDSLIPTQKDT